MATTPPPPTNLRTPPTPRHGAGYDGYDPYVTRHSSRIASRRAAAKSHSTPPPSSPTHLQARADVAAEGSWEQKPSATGALSPPSSTQNSPRRKPGNRVKVAPDNSQSISNERHIPSRTNIHSTHNKNTITHNNSASMADETLPTPAKTPRKKMIPDSNLAPRVLFKPSSVPENTHNQKNVKKGKKFSAFSLESFNDNAGAETGNDLQIFTDSRDRIPELDESEDNPFYQKPGAAKNSETKSDTRTTKRRKVESNGNNKRDKDIQEAIHRDDGMYYVFRGKKFFKKFRVESEDEDDEGLLASRSDLEDPLSDRNIRPLSRASIKPRLLFPTAEQRDGLDGKPVVTDEEATTDIEEHEDAEEIFDAPDNEVVMTPGPTTPNNQTTLSTADTPSSPKFTGRSLRSQSKMDAETTPSNTEKANVSFGIWQRTKSSSDGSTTSTPKPRKRGISSAEGSAGPAKKKVRGK